MSININFALCFVHELDILFFYFYQLLNCINLEIVESKKCWNPKLNFFGERIMLTLLERGVVLW